MLYAFVLGRVRDPHGAEDVFQETARVMVREQGVFRTGTDFGAWARSIARNRMKEYFRARQRSVPLSAEAERALESAHGTLDTDWWHARRAALRACLERVKGKGREVLGLYYGRGLTAGGVAQCIGRSATAVRIVLSRLRKKLRDCIESQLARA